MAWAQIAEGVGQGMGSIYDTATSADNAREAKAQGYLTADANETRVRASSAQALGEQRAAAVESGFDANTGSLATLQTQSAGNLELDALNQRYAGQINAWKQDRTIEEAAGRLNFIFDPVGKGKLFGPGTGSFSPKFNVGNRLTKTGS